MERGIPEMGFSIGGRRGIRLGIVSLIFGLRRWKGGMGDDHLGQVFVVGVPQRAAVASWKAG